MFKRFDFRTWLFLALLAAVGAAHAAAATPSYIFTVLAGGPTGNADGVGGAIQFNQPNGVAVDQNGTIYVADTGNGTIRVLKPGQASQTIRGAAYSTSTIRFLAPSGVAVDPAGDVFVLDSEADSVTELRASTLRGGPIYDFGSPTAIAADANGNIYVADASVSSIIKINLAAGTQTSVSDGTNGFGQVTGLAVDSAGNLYLNVVSDVGSPAMSGVWKASGGVYSELMQPGGLSNLATTNGVALDASGNLFATDGPYSEPASDLTSVAYSEVRLLPSGGAAGAFSTLQQYAHSAADIGQTLTTVSLTGIAVDTADNIYFFANGVLIEGSPAAAGATSIPAHALTVAAGAPATLTVSAAELGLMAGVNSVGSYQWFKNGVAIAGATGASWSIAAAQPTDAGVYSVVMKDSIGTTNSAVLFGVDVSPGETYLNTWTGASPLPTSTLFTSAAFDGSNFIVAGVDGSLWMSPDGMAWTRSGTVPSQVNSLIYAGAPAGLLGVGNGGVIFSAAAPGYAVTTQSSGTANLLTGVAVGNGRMVAVGSSGTAVSSSLATPNWAAAATGVTEDLNAVAFGAGKFVAVGMSGRVLTSPDGVTWSAQLLYGNADLYSIAYGQSGFVALSYDASLSGIYFSPDGVTWTPEGSLPVLSGPTRLIRVIAANGALVAVGSNQISTSTDGGLTWTSHASGTTAALEGIAYGAGHFVAVGDQGSVSVTAQAQARLVNLSANGYVPNGGSLGTGFTVQGTSKPVLLRGVGPGLAQFGLSGVLAAPQLQLFGPGGTVVASNAGWSGSAALAAIFAQVGAFSLSVTSLDAALVATVSGTGNSAQVSGLNGADGRALVEVYDTDSSNPASRLVNLSALAQVGAAGAPLVAGFVVSGTNAETVLLRGVGPGLGQFGLTGLLAAPVLTLYDHTGTVLASNTQWGGTALLNTAFGQVGAFALPVTSADTALLVTLAPGNYTAQLSGTNGATGQGLLEIYEAPTP